MKREIGFIGLGRMGLNMVAHLVEEGYRVVGYDPHEGARESAHGEGVTTTASIVECIAALQSPRVVWLMVPSKVVDLVLGDLLPFLAPGDTVIDGGNSFYLDSIRRHQELKARQVNFLDCGTSGGMSGARNGASIMVGGSEEVFRAHEDIFKTLATEGGYARVGAEGAGHFVKMVHNGIEYGMMGAIAEGMNVLKEHQEQFDLDLMEVLKPYEHESIITSKLVSWLALAYREGQIDAIEGVVPRGETEDEMEHITEIGDVAVLQAALAQRRATREHPTYIGKLVAAMRNQFGGHRVVEK